MSSGSHRGGLDPVLRYALPRARAQAQVPAGSTTPLTDQPLIPPPHDGTEFCGDRAIVEMHYRRTLEPERVPEPPQEVSPNRNWWAFAARTCGVLGFAGLMAWVLISMPDVTQLEHYVMQVVRSPGPSASAKARMSVPQSSVISSPSVLSSSVLTQHASEPPNGAVAIAKPQAPQTSERSDPQAQATPIPSGIAIHGPPADHEALLDEQTRPVPTREPSAAQRTSPDFVTRQLDSDELAAMLGRAGDFIKAGDLSSARLLLRRAAEAGSEEAALTLAGTFDPNVLAARGFQDGAADIALARLWYERAAQFGSSEAPRRLRLLANNSPQ